VTALAPFIIVSSAPAAAFAFQAVREKARDLAAAPFVQPTNRLPDRLRALSYPEWQSIQFKHPHALWRDQQLPFEVEFFHPGGPHPQLVDISEITPQGPRVIPFTAAAFSTGITGDDLPTPDGYAGFRITYPKRDFGELAVFLGASYFRMVGAGQVQGTSARGLALNTSQLGREEFPFFREYWLQRPDRRADRIVFCALLDSRSVAAAFEFTVTPGRSTAAAVKASFFPRAEVAEFGIAPLTSMFLHDENGRPAYTDFRPEVHDCDGLLLHTRRDEWIWRPLDRGKMLRLNAYSDEDPRGFGLLQRDRDFDHYQDLVARFEKRPGVWIQPRGGWGPGSVRLVQLPTDIEYTDNVVAYWVPAAPPKPGSALDLSYDILWTTNRIVPDQLGRVLATRIGTIPGDKGGLRFVVDFELDHDREGLDAEVTCGSGAEIALHQVLRNPVNDSWRLIIETTTPSKAVDLTATLVWNHRPISERWTYTWQP
jgi:glucans biosynthesis protein